MPHGVPCVFSCHIQTKMTPIMPIKSGAVERCCGSSAATRMPLRLAKSRLLWPDNEDDAFKIRPFKVTVCMGGVEVD